MFRLGEITTSKIQIYTLYYEKHKLYYSLKVLKQKQKKKYQNLPKATKSLKRLSSQILPMFLQFVFTDIAKFSTICLHRHCQVQLQSQERHVQTRLFHSLSDVSCWYKIVPTYCDILKSDITLRK